jgi:polyhydroxyalkanoate synthesis regulator phasin
MKDLLYAGLGGMLVLKEKVEAEVKKLEEKGKLSREEGEKFLKDLQEKGKEGEDEFKKKIKEALKEAIEELGLATKADLEKLKQEKS